MCIRDSSSIAAVAQVELITKTPASITGVRYVIEGGEEKSLEEIGAPEGTTFLVHNLFYNCLLYTSRQGIPHSWGALFVMLAVRRRTK